MTEHARSSTGVFLAALLIFAVTLPEYTLQVTDVSAVRVLRGDVPYRDFWTMYAPASFTVLSVIFAVFGQELIVSRLLGMLAAAAAVAIQYRVATRLATPGMAVLVAAAFGATFLGTGYHADFASYPPAILLVWIAIDRLAEWGDRPERERTLAVAGAWFGLALLFKHDVAGYALTAATVAIAFTARGGARRRLRLALHVVAGAGAAALVPIGSLVVMGAGRDMLNDLVVFPLTAFRYVRPEYFPIVPRFRPGLINMGKEVVVWTLCNLPTVAMVVGVFGLWKQRRSLTATQRLLLAFMLGAFPLYWIAAHVQINTHAVTLAGIGAVVAAAGITASYPRLHWRSASGGALVLATMLWCAVVCLEPAYRTARRVVWGTEQLRIPKLTGMSAPVADVTWMRRLAAALAHGQPGAALLVLGNRNDVHVVADLTPYWLSDRVPATRYHELHPGITDTEPIQREMLEHLANQPLPVLIREHRFTSDELDRVKSSFLRHVRVGSTLIDRWVAAHYAPGERFGPYELLKPKLGSAAWSAPFSDGTCD